jgi:lantibiotic modifying enzyme
LKANHTMTQSENGRCVVHCFEDVAGKSESAVLPADVRKQLFDMAINLLKKIESRYDPSVIPKDYSVYTGTMGIVLMYLKLLNIPEFSSYQNEFETKIQSFIHNALAASRKYETSSRLTPTFHCGEAGVRTIAAAYYSTKDSKKSDECVSKLVEMSRVVLDPNYESNEMLYGRVGYLFSMLYLSRTSNNEVGNKVASMIVALGEKMGSSEVPLMYEWHGKKYLGGAHGLVGILQTLLFTNEMNNGKSRSAIVKSIEYVANLARKENGLFPSRNKGTTDLIQWCHGPVGPVMLLCLAYKMFGTSSFLEVARLCSDAIWREGFLTKGPGLCHGISGNAYTFLTMYRATKETLYLNRALQFALACSDEKYSKFLGTPDHPQSLYEGEAGMVCLLADLLHPEQSYYPGYEFAAAFSN